MADPLNIVICTTPDDVALVEPIAELLRAPVRRSVSIVHDEPGGLPWWGRVVGEIRSAGLFIVALSPAALRPASSTATMVATALAFARACERECLFVSVADIEDEPLPIGIDRDDIVDCRALDATSVPELFRRLAERGEAATAPAWVTDPAPPLHLDRPRSVFISYRRKDTQYAVGPLRERIEAVLGPESVFHDVVSIPVGVDFRPQLVEGIGRADIVLVLIGRTWLEELNERRGGADADQVLVEVELALGSGKPVIPLLVDASMPAAAELPRELQALAYRNGLSLRPDPDFATDVDRVLDRMGFIPAPGTG
jgi:TIR domain